ncbi:MAG TPA: DUF4388 domain-containing protein [Kofleriaceae bacterium]|nr:DUF4388 domain-containing protein [Kofleriaceae bacterium]
MQARSGELAMRPLPAVLLDLHEELATGKLVLRRGRVSKTVDLVNGNPVSTASTPRDETLGHYLVSTGVIGEAQHRAAVERAATLGGKLGEALVALGILTVEQLIDQLGRQARHKLVQALRWPQGAWRFDPSSAAVEGMQLRMVEVVLGGLRETGALDLSRLARLDGMAFELTERGKRLRHELRRAFGERVVAVLQQSGQLAEIEKAFGDRTQARIAVDAMVLCDALVAKSVALGLGAVDPAKRTLIGVMPMREHERAVTAPEELYEFLFDDDPTLTETPEERNEHSAPIDLDAIDDVEREDSGVVSTAELRAANAGGDQAAYARQVVIAEHQRIAGADHYAVLLIDRDAAPSDVEDGFQIKSALFERAIAPGGPAIDLAKVAAIRQAYTAARDALGDPVKRAAYDRELAGGELVQGPPSIDTELSFRMAEELIAKQQWAQAIGTLKTVLARAPGEADYHAALGWAQWNAGQQKPEAADAARGHLNQALAIDPDHPAAHDYKGRIDAALRTDDATALFHLERALDRDPMRLEAVRAIESLLLARGELRRLERVLKRVLFRLRGMGGAVEAGAWARLARLYLEHLDNPTAGAAAVANARKLAPNDPEVRAVVERAEHVYREHSEPVRAGWREALGDPQSGAELVRRAEAGGHADAAFLAASTMVALGTADDAMRALYDRHRARSVMLPQQPLGRDHWQLLRHKEDTVELGALVELVAPAVHVLAPMTLAEGELDASQRIADPDLPQAFSWLRAQLGPLIGVGDSPVYARPELGAQIHVVACDPPVLVAGDEALTAPERPELVFRMARALTFLWPGRAVGASRPGRVLRAIVLAIIREAAATEVGSDDALAGPADAAIATLPPEVRARARAAALRLLSRQGGGLNLSLWARALSRTADRTAMLLCGDVPAAFAGAKDVGDLDKDLVEFAYSASHVKLRGELALVPAL